jgi:hypothetical protein
MSIAARLIEAFTHEKHWVVVELRDRAAQFLAVGD